jgi:hypothetical protein
LFFFLLTSNITNQRSTPSKSQWPRLSSLGNVSPKPGATDEPEPALKRLSSNIRKTPPSGQPQRTDSIDQQTPPTPLLRKKPSFEQQQQDRPTSSSHRITNAINDDMNTLSKVVTPQLNDRTPPAHSRSLTRSNSINPANKDQEKSSSGERSYHTSAAQSRRVSIGLNRSPIRAEELERVLTKVNL